MYVQVIREITMLTDLVKEFEPYDVAVDVADFCYNLIGSKEGLELMKKLEKRWHEGEVVTIPAVAAYIRREIMP